MRPCSVAIEVVPFGLELPPNSHYFGALARSADVLHYSFVAEKHNSKLLLGAATSGGKDCRPIYNTLSSDMYAAFRECYANKYCKACAKITAITINTTTLAGVLRQATADRAACLRSHPLYRISDKTKLKAT